MLAPVHAGLPLCLMSNGFGLKAHWLVVMAGVQLPATVPIAVVRGCSMTLAVRATGAVAVESPKRVRRVYVATWGFAIGQAVQFAEMSALILARERSAMGKEIYLIWIMGPSGGRPYRTVTGRALTEKTKKCPWT